MFELKIETYPIRPPSYTQVGGLHNKQCGSVCACACLLRRDSRHFHWHTDHPRNFFLFFCGTFDKPWTAHACFWHLVVAIKSWELSLSPSESYRTTKNPAFHRYPVNISPDVHLSACCHFHCVCIFLQCLWICVLFCVKVNNMSVNYLIRPASSDHVDPPLFKVT